VRRQVVVHDAWCKPAVPATGAQGQDEGTAWDHAITAWRGHVRWLYGERYADEKQARSLTRNCGPSSIKDSVRDATLPQLYRCEITARPCRSEAQRVDGR